MLQVPDSIFWKIAADETAWRLQLAMRELPELDYGRCLIFSDRLEELGYEQAALFCRASSHYISSHAIPAYAEDGKYIKEFMRDSYGFKFGKSNVIGSKLVSCVAVPIGKDQQERMNCVRFNDSKGYYFFMTPFFTIPLITWQSTRFISSHLYAPSSLREAIYFGNVWSDITFDRISKLTGLRVRIVGKQAEALHKTRQSYFRAVAKQEGWHWIADLD